MNIAGCPELNHSYTVEDNEFYPLNILHMTYLRISYIFAQNILVYCTLVFIKNPFQYETLQLLAVRRAFQQQKRQLTQSGLKTKIQLTEFMFHSSEISLQHIYESQDWTKARRIFVRAYGIQPEPMSNPLTQKMYVQAWKRTNKDLACVPSTHISTYVKKSIVNKFIFFCVLLVNCS